MTAFHDKPRENPLPPADVTDLLEEALDEMPEHVPGLRPVDYHVVYKERTATLEMTEWNQSEIGMDWGIVCLSLVSMYMYFEEFQDFRPTNFTLDNGDPFQYIISTSTMYRDFGNGNAAPATDSIATS